MHLWRGRALAAVATTALDATYEHRFFGASYLVNFDAPHAAARRVAFNASRNITTYPQQLANVPAGTFVPGVLNEILRARIPDPVERAQYIVDFMDQRDLPAMLAEPVTLYTQQITLHQNATATVGLLGVRNSVFFSVSRYQTSADRRHPATTLPPLPGSIDNNTQWGAGVGLELPGHAALVAARPASRTRYTEAEAPFDRHVDAVHGPHRCCTPHDRPKTRGYAGMR